jgi:heptosyltransferase-2
MKILLIRFSSIGDIVLTSPVITALKQKYPSAQIHYLTKKVFLDILLHNPKIDKIWSYDSNLELIIQQLKKEKLDWIIDLHNNLRSRWLCLRLGLKTRRLHKENWNKWKMVNLKSKISIPHIVDRYLKTLDFSIKNPIPLEYYCGLNDENHAIQLLKKHQIDKNYWVIVLSATHFTKKWLKEYFVELIQSLDKKIILLGGKTEIKESQWIENQLINNNHCINLCGKTSLNQSAAIIKNSEFVITHDTGLMHIACAYQKKMIILWGNTLPEMGFAPYQNPNALNISLDLPCKPCSKLGRKKCPKSHFHCMKNITPKMVLETSKMLLSI